MQDDVQLQLLKLIEQNPQVTQRELSESLGISLGKTNYCLKALKEKGWVKWGNFSNNPNKIQYLHLLTPVGLAEKAKLTLHFLERKRFEYDQLKIEIERLEMEVSQIKKEFNSLERVA